MLCPWEVTLLCSTRELQNPITNQCTERSLEYWALEFGYAHTHTHTHTHTQEKLWRSCGFAHAKWHIRCLTAWESVSIKPHNQWGPFKVLEMASDKCHFLSMSPLQVRCIPRAAAPGGIQLDNARDSKGDLLRGFYLCQWQGHTHVRAQKNHSQRKAVVQSDHIQSTCAFACCHWSQKKKKCS